MIDSNNPCFVFGLNLDSIGGATKLDCGEVLSSWIHVDYGHAGVNEFLSALGLPERIIHSLVQPDTRPRTVVSKGGALVIIRGINMNPGADPEDLGCGFKAADL